MTKLKYAVLFVAVAALLAQAVGLRVLSHLGRLGLGEAQFINAFVYSAWTCVPAAIVVVAGIAGLVFDPKKLVWGISFTAGALTFAHFALWLWYGL